MKVKLLLLEFPLKLLENIRKGSHGTCGTIMTWGIRLAVGLAVSAVLAVLAVLVISAERPGLPASSSHEDISFGAACPTGTTSLNTRAATTKRVSST